MGRVFKRKYRDKKTGAVVLSAKYTIEYYDGRGRKYREPAKTTSKERAEALLRKREQSVWEGAFFPEKKQQRQLTVAGLRDLWIDEHPKKRSLRHDRTRLGVVVEFLGEHRLLSTVAGEDVIDLRNHLSRKLATATVNRYLAALRAALNYASERGYSHRNPMAGIGLEDELNMRNRICSPEEYARLREAAKGSLRLAIIIAYRNGMRLGEIVGLRREQVDLKRGAIRLGAATKEGDIKNAPLPSEAAAEIEKLPRRLDGRLFELTSNDYSRLFAELCSELAIEDLRFHDFRHTAVTNFLEAGVDLLTIQSITGHKTLHMTKRYAHVSDRRRSEAMALAEAHAATKDRS